jgi:hypothetical protein
MSLAISVLLLSIPAADKAVGWQDGGDSERFWRGTGAGDASETKPE